MDYQKVVDKLIALELALSKRAREQEAEKEKPHQRKLARLIGKTRRRGW